MYKNPKEEVLNRLKDNPDYIDEFMQYAKEELESNSEHTKSILDEGLKICDENENIRGVAWCSGAIGWYFNYSGTYEKGVEWFLKANTLFKRINFADEALYIAKAKGKNKLVKYEDYHNNTMSTTLKIIHN